MRLYLAAAIALLSVPAWAQTETNDLVNRCPRCGIPSDLGSVIPPQPDRSWHLLTITLGGTVTLLKDLTQHECEFAENRVMGRPATDEERTAAAERREKNAQEYSAWRTKHHCKNDPGAIGSPTVCDGVMYEDPNIFYPASTIKSAECFQ